LRIPAGSRIIGATGYDDRPEKRAQAFEEEFEVARQIIGLRVKMGLTQQQLAEKVKTSQSCISRLESGSYRNVSMSFLERIGKALGAEPRITFRRTKSVSHGENLTKFHRWQSGWGKKTIQSKI
jgi:transcriptional regulator with XRE-family HTH domain